ncbi:Cap-specific mRNA (nucleoside-2'-O-)-methyltransferase 2 [Gryllus bimaculatus]|nr:Cap-specific mRNA (nucleoside-2'-O-)-methyltransferase 2 [Gryllus bimaculatus]
MTEKELETHFPTSFATNRTKCYETSTCENEFYEITRLFEKKFSFSKNSASWCLPNVDLMFVNDIWKVMKLQTIKEELNNAKSQLNDFDLADWHRHTNFTNKAGDILWKLRSEVEPEFVTQAWCKFYEIVMSFPLVPSQIGELKYFNSVHLCEAPGAFITSLNHFLQLHYPDVNWHWKATTLNPYYEGNSLSSMINDDRFIFHTLPCWTFGYDYTGDIKNLSNINHIVEEAKQMGEVLLVTADGSVDCHDKPAEQEGVVSSLHYYETIAALNILGVGLQDEGKVMFPFESIPQEFIDELLICSTRFKDFQVEAIKKNIEMLGDPSVNYIIKRFKYLAVQHFMKHYKLKKISDESKEVKETMSQNLDPHARKGSYSDRIQKKNSVVKKLLELHEELQVFNVTWTYKHDIKWLKIGFINPVKHDYGIVFVGFQCSNVDVLNFLNSVKEMCIRNMKSSEISVLAVLNITQLCGKMDNSLKKINHFPTPKRKCSTNDHEMEEIENGYTFCQCVTEINNVYMKEQLSVIINEHNKVLFLSHLFRDGYNESSEEEIGKKGTS